MGVLLNLAKIMVSVLHKQLEFKVEKLKCKKLEVIPSKIKKHIRTPSWSINHSGSVHTKFYSRD